MLQNAVQTLILGMEGTSRDYLITDQSEFLPLMLANVLFSPNLVFLMQATELSSEHMHGTNSCFLV